MLPGDGANCEEWFGEAHEPFAETEELGEAMMKVMDVQTPPAKPKGFMLRPEYIALEKKGLTILPPVCGVFLSCHPTTSQWHGGYPKGEGAEGYFNHAPSWGLGLRTEGESLRLALQFLWQAYWKRTGFGKDHLDKLKAEDIS